MGDGLKHISWDRGIIADAMHDVLSVPKPLVTPETTKTCCGKRVRYSKIDNENPTCETCIIKVRREWEATDCF